MKDTSGPAFPVSEDANMNEQEGLTKREYFAGLAMQGVLSDADILNKICKLANKEGIYQESAVGAYAVNLADALLKELKK
jgi:hypothetical protein